MSVETANEGVGDEIVKGSIFIDAATDRIINASIHLVVRNLRRYFRPEVYLIAPRAGIVPVYAWRSVTCTLKTVIKDHQVCIVGNGWRMLSDWRKSPGGGA